MKTLRELLTQKAIEKKYINESQKDVINDDILEEVLRDEFKCVWYGEDDVHRWRINFTCVCEILDNDTKRYFAYTACKGTNDNSWEDAGYRFEGIDQVVEVYPKEVTTINYFYNNGKKVS